MREYLFRGKRTDGNGWAIGSLLLRAYPLIEQFERQPDNTFSPVLYPVIAETVGQFTGEYDQNGNRIFEHDIVLFKSFKLSVAYANCVFRLNPVSGPYRPLFPDFHANANLMEIVGTIFEE